MMFVTRRRYLRDLTAADDRAARATERADAAVREAETARQVQRSQVDRRSAADGRAEELAAELEAERARRRAAERRVAALERQMDTITELDSPDVAAGTRWQETRADKQAPVAAAGLAASSPSGRLPRREPGLADGGDRP